LRSLRAILVGVSCLRLATSSSVSVVLYTPVFS
jgi:hypothetical protein